MKLRTSREKTPPAAAGASVSRPTAEAISRAAVHWYRANGRDLPWRRTADPYAILVSELMLQQTTVAVVLGYFVRFLQRFPTVEALAEAPEQEVLAQWAGLGYYRRARLLQAASRAVVEKYGGRFPADLETLQELPGVGRYTAGAVASFAFDLPAPIVEANTARLLARLFAVEGVLASPAVQKQLWSHAEALLPNRDGREHNSALMDLGALICTPVRPRCSECPLSAWCAARKLDRVHAIPAPPVKPEKLTRAFAGVVLMHNGRYLMRQIPAGEWHAGMFEFPKVPIESGSRPEEAVQSVRRMLEPYARTGEFLRFAELKYTVTKHRVTLTVWRAQATAVLPLEDRKQRSEKHLPAPEFRWMSLAEIQQLPVGSAQRRLLNLLSDPNDLFGNVSE